MRDEDVEVSEAQIARPPPRQASFGIASAPRLTSTVIGSCPRAGPRIACPEVIVADPLQELRFRKSNGCSHRQSAIFLQHCASTTALLLRGFARQRGRLECWPRLGRHARSLARRGSWIASDAPEGQRKRVLIDTGSDERYVRRGAAARSAPRDEWRG